MSNLVFVCVLPHPPLIIPAIGKGDLERVANTVTAYKNMAQKIAHLEPDRLVIIIPHGPVFHDRLVLVAEEKIEGDFAQFNAPQAKVALQIDQELCHLIVREASAIGIETFLLDQRRALEYGISLRMDHGAGVPLYYLAEAGVRGYGIHLTIGMLPYRQLFHFGEALRQAIEKSGCRTVIVVSGDFSHRLIRGAPAGYHPQGREFDQKLIQYLKDYQVEKILNMDPQLIENAAECGLRPLIIALGALNDFEVETEIVSYEGPFGVGYLVAGLTPRQKEGKEENEYVALARQALNKYVREGVRIKAEKPLKEKFKRRAGVFVSLKKGEKLRGCIGTFVPTQPNLAEEIIENAISAGTRDPRFPPLVEEELEQISYAVDILSPPEAVDNLKELDPKRYGVIVRRGERRGLLLPDLEGVDTVEEQLSIARQKAGITPDEQVEIYRFRVERYR
ncbi:MAG: AmmeMemoRadiSam system protein A [Dethiobacteria bacterium]